MQSWRFIDMEHFQLSTYNSNLYTLKTFPLKQIFLKPVEYSYGNIKITPVFCTGGSLEIKNWKIVTKANG